MGAQMAIPLFLVISLATKPDATHIDIPMFLGKIQFAGKDAAAQYRRPARLPAVRRSLTSGHTGTLAMVDLPAPDNPVKNKVNPCCLGTGIGPCEFAPTTSGNVAHSGTLRPVRNRPRISLPDMEIVWIALVHSTFYTVFVFKRQIDQFRQRPRWRYRFFSDHSLTTRRVFIAVVKKLLPSLSNPGLA